MQGFEPALIEAFISELSFETFDVAVLHGFAQFDEQVPKSVRLRPSNEGTTGEFRALLGPNRFRVAAQE